ncbi:MAG: hypothetical protein Q4C82_06890 [Eubacteriales bacterium]|nr:hypothetical protein [Eubacteriales bacterium]
MEFFDKVNELARAAADKTAEVVEDTRLKAQILSDEKSIRELEAKIGAYYYGKFAAGEPVDEAVREWCTAVSVHKANIEEKKEALNSARRTEETAGADAPAGEEKEKINDDPFENP